MDILEFITSIRSQKYTSDLDPEGHQIGGFKINDKYMVIIDEVDVDNLLLSAVIGGMHKEEAERSALTLLGLNIYFVYDDDPYITWCPSTNFLLLVFPINTRNIIHNNVKAELERIIKNIDFFIGILNELEINFEHKNFTPFIAIPSIEK